MQAELAKHTDRINFVTRSSIFMPILLVTQINAGIYMVFGGPYVNRLFEVEPRTYLRASVLATRQLISIVILIVANLLKRKFDMKMVTRRDWKYFFLCGKRDLI